MNEMQVKVKQMQVISAIKNANGRKKDSDNSGVNLKIQEAIDLSLENYRLRKRY
jgi:hypothetical protein